MPLQQSSTHYDLCIIGSGSGNTIIDERFDRLRVAIVDQGVGTNAAFGGTCLNVGCIPSKMLSVPAELAQLPELANRVGVRLRLEGIDQAALQERIYTRIDRTSAAGLRWRRESDNVTVHLASASFVDEHTLQVGAERISADTFVLAAGSRPTIPDLPGLDDPDLRGLIHTSETIMRGTAPERLVILGGGVEAVEYAHIFSGLGSQVTVINRSERMLRREDDDIATRITEILGRRVSLRMNQRATLVEPNPSGGLNVIALDEEGIEYCYPADALVLCLGRTPNGDLLEVGKAGVQVDEAGFVRVDEFQRSTAGHIWALGDVCSPLLLKHVANHEARVVQHNLLHPDDLVRADHRFVPRGIFCHPQIAAVGATEAELRAAGRHYIAAIQSYASVAMGWALADQEHFCKLLVDPTSGQLLGAHIIGPEACSLLQPLSQAMHFGTDIEALARQQYWVHPAMTEVVENALLTAQSLRESQAGRLPGAGG